MKDTPRCHALMRSRLDSNDIDAWKTLAFGLEETVAQLQKPLDVLRNADNRHLGRLPTYLKEAIRELIRATEKP